MTDLILTVLILLYAVGLNEPRSLAAAQVHKMGWQFFVQLLNIHAVS